MFLALKLLGAGLVSILLAAALLASRLNAGLDELTIANGEWRTSLAAGSAEADPTTRAIIAIGALLASTREDSVYYRLATVDGEPLRLGCTYRLQGTDYAADWWSITAYGWDHYLIPNPEDRYSYNNENLERAADGTWEILVSATRQDGNWIPVGPAEGERRLGAGAGDFDLLLRLYTPGNAYLTEPGSAPLPRASRVSCES